MPAYWISRVDVTDEESYARYAKLAGPALAAFGGEFLARGGRSVPLEGVARSRNVLVRFPTVEAGEAAYNSPAYQEALSHARGASVREVLVVEGLE